MLPDKRPMGLHCWMRPLFRDWIDYNGLNRVVRFRDFKVGKNSGKERFKNGKNRCKKKQLKRLGWGLKSEMGHRIGYNWERIFESPPPPPHRILMLHAVQYSDP